MGNIKVTIEGDDKCCLEKMESLIKAINQKEQVSSYKCEQEEDDDKTPDNEEEETMIKHEKAIENIWENSRIAEIELKEKRCEDFLKTILKYDGKITFVKRDSCFYHLAKKINVSECSSFMKFCLFNFHHKNVLYFDRETGYLYNYSPIYRWKCERIEANHYFKYIFIYIGEKINAEMNDIIIKNNGEEIFNGKVDSSVPNFSRWELTRFGKYKTVK